MGIKARQAYFISPPIVTNGLVFYVNAGDQASYPGSGTTWNDLSGPNTGTLANTPVYNTSVGGNLQFNGTTQYASFAGVSLETVHSVEMWIKTPASSINTTNTWIWGTSTADRYFEYNSINNSILFYVNNTILNATSVLPTPGIWHHAVFARNDTSYTLYLNGINAYSGADAGWSGYAFTLTGIAGSFIRAEGSIASVKAYNRILSAEEVVQNYNAHKAKFGLL